MLKSIVIIFILAILLIIIGYSIFINVFGPQSNIAIKTIYKEGLTSTTKPASTTTTSASTTKPTSTTTTTTTSASTTKPASTTTAATTASTTASTPTPYVFPPHDIPIPSFITDISRCDYPMLWQGFKSVMKGPTNIGNVITDVVKGVCSNNPEMKAQNITNLPQICSMVTDLSYAFSGVVPYSNINQNQCPAAILDPISNELNETSVCNLPNYVLEARQFETQFRVKYPYDISNNPQLKNIPSIVDYVIKNMRENCSASNPNACIIGNAMAGVLPTYCSIPTSAPIPTIPIQLQNTITNLSIPVSSPPPTYLPTPTPTIDPTKLNNVITTGSSIGFSGF